MQKSIRRRSFVSRVWHIVTVDDGRLDSINHRSNSRAKILCVLLALAVFAIASHQSVSANVAIDEVQAEARALKAYERYVLLLKRNPRAGVSLDRIYGHHIDRGTLDEFVQQLSSATAASDDDGSDAMILGLVESRRGRDAKAVKAFETAERKRPDDPMVSWYLGQSLVAVGKTDAASAALERSIDKEIPRAVQEKVFQLLGRIYQRNQQPDKAMELWKRFEQAFPNDERVQVQIATIQIEENHLEDALARYEAIATKATDPYKRVQFGIKVADLKLQLGQTEDGLAAFETLLEELKPSSWLYNDVRDRIEESWLRTDDYAGLVDYYQNWIDSHPDDLEAMSRIGKYLAIQGRGDAAQEWYAKAIAKAPSDPKLRLAFIEQLIGDRKYAAAIQQYEQLAIIDRGNPDHIERWGMLYLRHPDLNRDAQQQKAAEIWNQLIDGKEEDVVAISRVADLFRSAQMTDQAIAQYRKAIELEPQNPQYREYLGEYFHILHRADEAKEVWQAMVEGDQRTTQNLTRLSEVYKSFGYVEEALTALEAACDMDPEFGDLIRFSSMLREAGRFDDSLAQLDRVEAMAASADETQIILEARIKTLSESGQLSAATAALERKVVADSSSQQWRVLAFYQEGLNRLPDAARSAAKAVELEPDSIPAWSVAARVMEKAGLLAKASDANRTLAGLDRRFRTQYLKKIAELERRLGRIDDAIQAAQDVITSAPGNPENYRFYSDLCFQLGKSELGLDALRRTVRVNPSDVESLTRLAQALADQFKTDEAIELYWRAFQQAEKLDGKISVVQTLAELYIRTNAFDKLVTRLKNLGKELSQQRDMSICLANAYQATGDIGLAREQLKGLLKEDSRDVILLDELALLAEQANEYEDAIDYQKQIVKLTRSEESRSRLASLLLRSGNVEAAEELWANSTTADSEPHRQVQSIDDLMTADKLETARKLCDSLLANNKEDWDALLRLAVIDWKEKRTEDAAKRCEQILAMRKPVDAPSHLKQSKAANNLAASGGRQNGSRVRQEEPFYQVRSLTMYRMKNVLGLSATHLQSQSRGSEWAVSDFGECRIAAIAIQMAVQKDDSAYLKQLQAKAKATIQQDSTAAWDWWYSLSFPVQSLRTAAHGSDEQREVAELIYQAGEPEGQLLYANALHRTLSRSHLPEYADAKPITEHDAAVMVETLQNVIKSHPQWSRYTGSTIQLLVSELKRSNFHDLADEFMQGLLSKDARLYELEEALQITAKEGDIDTMLQIVERLIQRQQENPSASGQSSVLAQLGTTFSAQVEKLAKEGNDWDSIKKLIVKFLDIRASTFNPLTSSAIRSRASLNSLRGATVISGSLVPSGASRTVQIRQLAQLNMSAPQKYYSASDQQFFQTLHSIYASRPANELKTILNDYLTSATGTQVVFAELALANISTLNGNVEQSVVHLVRVAAAAPDDADLRLLLAQYYQQRRNYAEALQLLDTIDAADQLIVKDKELLALELASKTGNTERSRTAAERLFGMRLDSNTALMLSNKMQAMGMKEMAASLLARTRKVAGNDLATLLALLKKYTSAGDTDVSCQIAHQILRQTNGQKVSRTNRTSPSTARKAAVAVLAKSGQLESIIQRTVDQLSRSPKSVRLHQTLQEYYSASGRSKEAADIAKKLVALVPVTADSLIREGQKLERSRKYPAACDKYLAAFKKDPQQVSKNYLQYIRTFQNGKRLVSLADVMLENDGLKKMNNNYQMAMQLVDALFKQSGRSRSSPLAPSKDPASLKALELFEAAWDAFPNYRGPMVAAITDPSVWARPEMTEYAQEGFIPQSLQQSIATPWQGIAAGLSYNSNSEVNGTLWYVLRILNKDRQRRTAYFAKVEAAVAKFDMWHGGKVLLAMLNADAGHLDEAYRLIESLENDPEVLYIPTLVSWVIGGRFAPLAERRFADMSIRILENSLKKDNSASGGLNLDRSPERRLAVLYSRIGETEKARQTLIRAVDGLDHSRYAAVSGYKEYLSINTYMTVAGQLLKIGCPFEALKYYRKVNPELLKAAGRYGTNSSATRQLTSARQGEKTAMVAITPESILALLERQKKQPLSSMDLMLLPPDTSADSAAIRSLILDGVLLLRRRDEGAKQLTSILRDALRESDASSSFAGILAIEFGTAIDDAELVEAGRKDLKTYLANTPPDTAKEFSEIGLWIPARSLLKKQQSQEFAETLAKRAMIQAEANSDDRWLISMMKEKGDIAIAIGDLPKAEAAWSKMLDAVLADNSSPTLPTNTIVLPADRRKSSGTTESSLDELRKRLLSKPASVTP